MPLLQVHQDLLRKNGWTDLRAVSLGLPPCACCPQDSGVQREGHEPGTASSEHVGTSADTSMCSNRAQGIAGTVREEESNGDGDEDSPEAGTAKFVFAVNAGCPIPTRRLVGAFRSCAMYKRDASFTSTMYGRSGEYQWRCSSKALISLRSPKRYRSMHFSVAVRCLPSRFGDVVEAAEEHLRLFDMTRDQTAEAQVREKGHLSCVLAAFCDGSSIM